MASLRVLAFDHEGRPVQFDTWLDDLQLYLLSDSKDGVSLFDIVSGAATAPHTTAHTQDSTGTVQRCSRPLLLPYHCCSRPPPLPYLFLELSAFATVEDLVSHIRASDARYLAAIPAEFLDRNPPPMYITLYFIVTCLPDSLRSVRDHFLSLDPTSLTVDLLEQHLLAAETSAVAVGAARGTPRQPFFEGCSPSPLAPSYASAAATADVSNPEDVGAASASAKRCNSKGKRSRGGSGYSGGSGGGSGSGGRGGSGGGGGGGSGGGSGGSGGSSGCSGGSGGSGGGGTGGGGTGAQRLGSGGGQRQQQQRRSETLSSQQLREWYLHGASGGSCRYVIRTGERAGHTCGRLHTQHRCFSRLDDAWRAEFGDDVELPRWADLQKSRIAIFDLDFDAILSAMYALSAAALGASEFGTLPGTARAEALHTFTLDSGASRCFFHDSTTLTPLPAPVPVRLADPSGGPDVARSSTVLPCPAVPSASLSGLDLPLLSTNLVSTAALQDAMVTTTTPGGQRVSICTCTRTARHLAMFTHRPGSSLYTLLTELSQVAASAQVSASSQVDEGRQRAAPHSLFPLTTAPLQTLHMDVWGRARVSGQSRERYFVLVVDDYTRYTTVFPFRNKGQVVDILIPWIRTVRLQFHGRFGQDLPVLRLHYDRGGEFSSNLLREFCRGEGILQSFTLPYSPQQNGIAKRHIGLVMELARTSMIHAVAPHFLWLFAVQYAAHQLNIWPRISLPETSPTLRWTGERRVLPSQDVTFDESVPFYRLFPYRSTPPPPPPLFLALGSPLEDPLPPQGLAPLGVSKVDPLSSLAPVQAAVGSGAAPGAASGGAAFGGIRVRSGSTPLLVSPPVSPDYSVAPPPGSPVPAMPSWHALAPPCLWPTQVSASPPALTCHALPSVRRGAAARLSSLLLVSPDDYSTADSPYGRDLSVLRLHSNRGGEFSSNLSQDFCRGEGILQPFTLSDSPKQNGIAERCIGLVMEVARTSMIHAAAPHFLWALAGSRAFVHDTSTDKLFACAIPCIFLCFVRDALGWQFYHPTSRHVFPSQDVTFDNSGTEGAGSRGAERERVEPRGAESEGANSGGAEPWGAASSRGPAAPRAGGTGDAGAGAAGVTAGVGGIGGTAAAGPRGARTRGAGAAGTGGVGGAGAGYSTEPTAAGAGGSCAVGAGAGGDGAGGAGVGGTGAGGVGPVGAGAVDPGAGGARGTVRLRPYFVPLLQQVLGTPSSTGLTPLLCPPPDRSQPPLQPASPLPAPSPYTEQSGGRTERCEPASRPVLPVRTAHPAPRLRPPPFPGTHAMARHPSFESAAAFALVAELLDIAPACRLDSATALVSESVSASPPSVGDECALGMDVLEDTQEDFECLAATVPRFASMLLAPEGDPDAPDIPTPRSYAEAITGPYSSHWQAAMDAEMASWKSTGTYVHEVPPPGANIVDGMWIFRVKRPPGSPPTFKARYVARGFSQRKGVDYFETFSPTLKITTLRVLLHVAAQRDYELHSLDFSTAFFLRRPVYGLRQAPRKWHDTLRTTLAALGFAPSTADPLLFLSTDTSLPPFYVLAYVDDLVFATADTEALTLSKSELQKRHTCTDLGELRSYLGLQITRDRTRRTITLTQSHMVHQVLERFGFQYSSPQPNPLSTSHSLSAPPSNESVEPSGPYPELVGCLMYLMACTRPDFAYPLSLVARYEALGRHQKVHGDAAKRVLRYLCSTSGMGLVLGGYTFSLGSGSALWRATRSSSVLCSSCEAEIYAGAMAAQELRWLTYLLSDLGEQPRLPPQCGQLRLAYVATRANIADVFTKALLPGDHQRFATLLGLLALLFVTGLSLYQATDSVNQSSLMAQLTTVEMKPGKKGMAYISRCRGLRDRLLRCGGAISEEAFVTVIIAGLGPHWRSTRALLRAHGKISEAALYAKIHAEQQDMDLHEERHKKKTAVPEFAFHTQRRYNNNSN
ncbi:unnamed protein product [Closterium sp. NIES-53]